MYTLLKSLSVREKMLQKGMKMFSAQDFERIFNLPKYKTKYFLEKESKGGLLLRLKNGLYCLKTDTPSEEEIANRLYQPSYISFEYALASYNVLPEITYWVTSATTKPTRNFEIIDKNFAYYKVKKQVFTGYSLVKEANKSFLMAEPEKAMADYLYFVVLGKKKFNERLNTEFLNKKKLLAWGKLFQREKLIELISKLK